MKWRRAMKSWYELSGKEQIARWENVLRVLRALTPHERRRHWNMNWWGNKTECGTVACAAGHCGLDPWFRRRGFKLEFEMGWADDDPVCTMDHEMVLDFFGSDGCANIFFNGQQRSVGEVIREVKAYLKQLREEVA